MPFDFASIPGLAISAWARPISAGLIGKYLVRAAAGLPVRH